MKIILTGGGSGGHFFPIIAVAEALNDVMREEKILEQKLYYISTDPYNEGMLYDNNVEFRRVAAGKIRRYFSLLNIVDGIKTTLGSIEAFMTVFSIYPDVVFGKGGFASFPTLLAARLLRIPVVIHESDTVPGKVNRWAGKFAKKIAVSFPEATEYFDKKKVAFTSHPIRKEIQLPLTQGAHEFLKLEEKIPTILILGGSQGAQLINEEIIGALPELITRYQIIHQTGINNLELVQETAKVVLGDNPHRERYKPFGFLNDLAMRMSAGTADIVISRAGSTIFEIASWGKPSIIIPITNSNGDHQRRNAFAYARTGAATVIEEANLNNNIIVSEVDRLMKNQPARETMSKAASAFVQKDAARKIANALISIALKHED